MDEFPGLLQRDFGLRPQGKGAPMSGKTGAGSAARFGSGGGDLLGGDFPTSRRGKMEDDDLFGAPRKFSSVNVDLGSDPFFVMGAKSAEVNSSPSMPVFDKPVYDDEEDIFSGVPGLKKGAAKKNDVFGGSSYGDDLLAGLGSSQGEGLRSNAAARGVSSDEILPGFGESGKRSKSSASSNHFSPSLDDDFLGNLGGGKAFSEDKRSGFTNHSPPPYDDDLLGGLGGVSSSSGRESRSQKKEDVSGFDDLIPGFGLRSGLSSDNKHQSSVSPEKPASTVSDDPFAVFESTSASNFSKPKANLSSQSVNKQKDFVPPRSTHVETSSDASVFVHKDIDSNSEDDGNLRKHEENSVEDDDLWVTVSEIQLFTSPTTAPPPSRPPPLPTYRSKQGRRKKIENDHFAPQNTGTKWDGIDDFGTGRPPSYAEKEEENPAAAAMREAMDKAEAKFKNAREVRERERENEREKERLEEERQQREIEKEKERRRLELERERERERARQVVERANREARERAAAEARQKAERTAREQAERAAVQRAQAEARERAALEAKERAEKLAAEKERAAVEARERAGAEAREREAREKASRERAAREKAAIERATSEARVRAQRAAVERAAAEARDRAAAEAREKAAAMAREKQQRNNDNDLDSFFGMGSRATSAPKERSTSSGPNFDAQFTNNVGSERGQRTAGGSSSMRRPSSTTNIMDDLTSVFSGKSSDEFQEIEGETEERRRARFEREQRTRQRTAKALAEKNERELQVQKEQAERDRIADTLNIEIKRWSAGKEGNLRALLSTLQYVLWPDSGWQPVSLTDLITAASVKKVYRKATLCVHPDKVVSGTVQQKYIAEKVFDLLKEAWNKFNSEELF